jgi:hypothetical protein
MAAPLKLANIIVLAALDTLQTKQETIREMPFSSRSLSQPLNPKPKFRPKWDV